MRYINDKDIDNAVERRFIAKGKSRTKIIIDTETGIQYLYVRDLNESSLTLLVDKDGKPLLDQDYINNPEKYI